MAASSFYNAEATQLIRERLKRHEYLYIYLNDLGFYLGGREMHNLTTYSEKSNYFVRLFGRLQNGQKVNLIVTDVEIYIDIMIPNNINILMCKLQNKQQMEYRELNQQIYESATKVSNVAKFEFDIKCEKVKSILKTIITANFRTEIKFLKPMIGFDFNPNNSAFMRVYFNNYKKRKECIDMMIKYGFCVYSDDTSYEYLQKLVEYNYRINLAGSNLIRKYTIIAEPTDKYPVLTMKCSVNDLFYSPFGEDRDIIKYNMRSVEITKDKYPMIDIKSCEQTNIMIMNYDIETISLNEGNYDFPEIDGDNVEVFLISFVLSWQDELPFHSVSLCIGKRDQIMIRDDCDKITGDLKFCTDERELLFEFCKYINIFKPDIICGHNSVKYDNPFIFGRLRYHSMTHLFTSSTSALNFKDSSLCDYREMTAYDSDYILKKQAYKVFSDLNEDIFLFKSYGMVSADTMLLVTKFGLEGLRNYKLDTILNFLNLPTKTDMPIQEMFRTYAKSRREMANTAKGIDNSAMVDVIYYCLNDALSCSRIWNKLRLLEYFKSKAEIAFVTLENALIKADSIKCISLILANSKEYVISYSLQIKDIPGKYPGGFVLPPQHYGLYLEGPIGELDFNSLYPSIMTCYNISIETIVENEANAIKLREMGYTLTEINFRTTQNYVVRSWIVSHGNKKENMAIYPLIQQNLKARRSQYKKIMEAADEKLTLISMMEDGKVDRDEELIAQKSDLKFISTKNNSVQSAIKVYMNTFYGAAGSKSNILYNISVAGATTTLSVKATKKAHSIAKEHAFFAVYGDTDSMYLRAPDSCFMEIHRKYLDGAIDRDQYWSQMCKINIERCDQLNKIVNNEMVAMTGNAYLKMSHDTTGFPSYWASKKKYAYLKQCAVINESTGERSEPYFREKKNIKKFKIKGLELIKRGHSKAVNEYGKEIIFEMFNADNIPDYITKNIAYAKLGGMKISYAITNHIQDSIYNIIYNMIKRLYEIEWDINLFVREVMYKPHKKNLSNNLFRERMIARGVDGIPAPNEKFKYVYVQPETIVDDYGRYISYKTGEIMELLSEFEKPDSGMKLYKSYYILHEFMGMFTRFITHANKNIIKKDEKLSNSDKHVLLYDYVNNVAVKFINSDIDKEIISLRESIANCDDIEESDELAIFMKRDEEIPIEPEAEIDDEEDEEIESKHDRAQFEAMKKHLIAIMNNITNELTNKVTLSKLRKEEYKQMKESKSKCRGYENYQNILAFALNIKAFLHEETTKNALKWDGKINIANRILDETIDLSEWMVMISKFEFKANKVNYDNNKYVVAFAEMSDPDNEYKIMSSNVRGESKYIAELIKKKYTIQEIMRNIVTFLSGIPSEMDSLRMEKNKFEEFYTNGMMVVDFIHMRSMLISSLIDIQLWKDYRVYLHRKFKSQL